MHKVSLYIWPVWRICVRYERVSMCMSAPVCLCGNPVSLTSSFLSEIKVKWVIYHENMWLGLLSLPCPLRLCACVHLSHAHTRCEVEEQYEYATADVYVRSQGGLSVSWLCVRGDHLSLPMLWLMVYIGLFSHACFLVYRFMLSSIKAP